MFKALALSSMISLSASFACGSINPVEITPYSGIAPKETAPPTTIGIKEVVLAETPTTTTTIPEPVKEVAILTPIPMAPLPGPNYGAIMVALRQASPQDLIAYLWKDTPHVKLMLAIASRESGFNCAIKNPHSSATGLFQTIGGHKALAASMGLSWTNIAGPDCLDDALLAFQLYNHGKGLSNWNPLPRV